MEKSPEKDLFSRTDISDEDVIAAMRKINGFLDITPGDFKEVYRFAFNHAINRVLSAKARDIMTKRVHTVRPDTPLKDVAATLSETGVAGVPVVDEGGMVEGIISEKDFLAKMGGEGRSFMGIIAECLQGKGCLAIPVRKQAARDIMSSPAITVGPDEALADIAGLFSTRKINRVPVVDEGGKLLGIVSRADVVKAFTDMGSAA